MIFDHESFFILEQAFLSPAVVGFFFCTAFAFGKLHFAVGRPKEQIAGYFAASERICRRFMITKTSVKILKYPIRDENLLKNLLKTCFYRRQKQNG